uniref:PHA/PHB synthase family protein n=1 Tax=Sphingomonas bacterium TaxID=1895847 RepID=UPI0020C741F8
MTDPNPLDWLRTVGAAQLKLMNGALDAMGATEGGASVAAFWREGLKAWEALAGVADAPVPPSTDKRFTDPAWDAAPFAQLRAAYEAATTRLMAGVDAAPVADEAQRERLRFSARLLADAMSPANFPWTNPTVMARTAQTGGENLVKGMEHLLADLGRGQLTHTAPGRFELGRDLATTPGQVIKRTPLYELIQYAPATDTVLAVPLVIFPPWINRFYILDLTPEKSFIRWAVGQGLTVFTVSWKSADAGMKDVAWDDYVAAQLDAIATVRDLLGVTAAHAIGYCVAGTTLAATLALLAARGEADRIASATFFTAQVDFAAAGELRHFIDDDQLRLLAALSPEGFLDGRYMAATFNLLRGRDLIWNTVTKNYLLGEDYPAFDLLHWNGDTTNLPAGWHQSYLTDLYRDNRLVEPGALSVDGTPLDLGRVETPTYVQAGREDHIAPAASVWKITHHFKGPLRFVLAGSGHIAGVVNPPAAGKYQYWTNDAMVGSLDEFVAGATETKGSWWPDWMAWLAARDGTRVPATGARVPGGGSLP